MRAQTPPRLTDMRIDGLHHVAIIASDYARSKRFYTEVLGLRVIAEHYRAERDSWKLDLALPDGTQVELFSFPSPPPRASAGTAGERRRRRPRPRSETSSSTRSSWQVQRTSSTSSTSGQGARSRWG